MELCGSCLWRPRATRTFQRAHRFCNVLKGDYGERSTFKTNQHMFLVELILRILVMIVSAYVLYFRNLGHDRFL